MTPAEHGPKEHVLISEGELVDRLARERDEWKAAAEHAAEELSRLRDRADKILPAAADHNRVLEGKLEKLLAEIERVRKGEHHPEHLYRLATNLGLPSPSAALETVSSGDVQEGDEKR